VFSVRENPTVFHASEALDQLKRGTTSGKKLVIRKQETDGIRLKI
jgi:hypothetical protein